MRGGEVFVLYPPNHDFKRKQGEMVFSSYSRRNVASGRAEEVSAASLFLQML